MTFRRRATASLIAAVILVVALMAVLSNRLFSGLTDSVENSQFELMQSIVDSGLTSAESRAQARADMIASLPATRKLFAAKDRPGLLAEFGPMFQIQKEKYGVDQGQFHVPPAVSFLRLHDPATFGDDLSTFRPLVVAINRDHLARTGFAVARSGPAIFGIVPVLDEAGGYIGSFEIGIEFGDVLDNLKASYGLELALFIEEQPLRDFAKGVSGEILSEQNRLGKHIKFHSTHWDLMQTLVRSNDLAAVDEPVRYTREALGVTYGVLLIPIRNNAGEPLGVVAVARDFSGSRAASKQSVVWQVTLALFGIILLSGAVLVVIRGFLLRPLGVLSERMAAWAAGDPEATMEDVEVLCDELQELAGHFEKLKARGDSGSKEEDGS